MDSQDNAIIYCFDLLDLNYLTEIKNSDLKAFAAQTSRPIGWTRLPPLAPKPNATVFWSVKSRRWYYDESLSTKLNHDVADGVGQVSPLAVLQSAPFDSYIIDNFYANPESVREEALREPYPYRTRFHSRKTGVRTNTKVIQGISRLLGRKLHNCWTTHSAYTSSISSTTKIKARSFILIWACQI